MLAEGQSQMFQGDERMAMKTLQAILEDKFTVWKGERYQAKQPAGEAAEAITKRTNINKFYFQCDEILGEGGRNKFLSKLEAVKTIDNRLLSQMKSRAASAPQIPAAADQPGVNDALREALELAKKGKEREPGYRK